VRPDIRLLSPKGNCLQINISLIRNVMSLEVLLAGCATITVFCDVKLCSVIERTDVS